MLPEVDDRLLEEPDDELDDELREELDELLDELDDDVLDELEELDEALLLDDELLELLLEELDDEPLELLLALDVLLDEDDVVDEDELEAPPALPPVELEAASGEVGVDVQPAVNPAATTAAGAPESSSRKSRRFLRSPGSVAGGGVDVLRGVFDTGSSRL